MSITPDSIRILYRMDDATGRFGAIRVTQQTQFEDLREAIAIQIGRGDSANLLLLWPEASTSSATSPNPEPIRDTITMPELATELGQNKIVVRIFTPPANPPAMRPPVLLGAVDPGLERMTEICNALPEQFFSGRTYRIVPDPQTEQAQFPFTRETIPITLPLQCVNFFNFPPNRKLLYRAAYVIPFATVKILSLKTRSIIVIKGIAGVGKSTLGIFLVAHILRFHRDLDLRYSHAANRNMYVQKQNGLITYLSKTPCQSLGSKHSVLILDGLRNADDGKPNMTIPPDFNQQIFLCSTDFQVNDDLAKENEVEECVIPVWEANELAKIDIDIDRTFPLSRVSTDWGHLLGGDWRLLRGVDVFGCIPRYLLDVKRIKGGFNSFTKYLNARLDPQYKFDSLEGERLQIPYLAQHMHLLNMHEVARSHQITHHYFPQSNLGPLFELIVMHVVWGGEVFNLRKILPQAAHSVESNHRAKSNRRAKSNSRSTSSPSAQSARSAQSQMEVASKEIQQLVEGTVQRLRSIVEEFVTSSNTASTSPSEPSSFSTDVAQSSPCTDAIEIEKAFLCLPSRHSTTLFPPGKYFGIIDGKYKLDIPKVARRFITTNFNRYPFIRRNFLEARQNRIPDQVIPFTSNLLYFECRELDDSVELTSYDSFFVLEEVSCQPIDDSKLKEANEHFDRILHVLASEVLDLLLKRLRESILRVHVEKETKEMEEKLKKDEEMEEKENGELEREKNKRREEDVVLEEIHTFRDKHRSTREQIRFFISILRRLRIIGHLSDKQLMQLAKKEEMEPPKTIRFMSPLLHPFYSNYHLPAGFKFADTAVEGRNMQSNEETGAEDDEREKAHHPSSLPYIPQSVDSSSFSSRSLSLSTTATSIANDSTTASSSSSSPSSPHKDIPYVSKRLLIALQSTTSTNTHPLNIDGILDLVSIAASLPDNAPVDIIFVGVRAPRELESHAQIFAFQETVLYERLFGIQFFTTEVTMGRPIDLSHPTV